MEGHFLVLVSYAHKDNENDDPSRRYLDRLKEALEPLALQTQVRAWSDQDFEIGDRWENEIRHGLTVARAVVLLVSPAFLASNTYGTMSYPSS